MDFDVFRNKVSKIKNIDLPGESAHFLMEPPERRKFLNENSIVERNPREAGVMALFYPKEKKTHILLILRKSYPGVHSNQVAFPGGKREAEDQDLLQTALRETEEEVGVAEKNIVTIKELTKVYIPPSNFWVQPFMGLYPQPEPFVKQEDEVEAILEIPFNQVLEDKVLINQQLSTSYAKNITVPAFKLNGHIVWGATAMMLNEIKLLVRQVL